MSRYTACYDISNDRRRYQVARILLGYGRRVQESVFEVWLDPDELRELRVAVGSLLEKTDRFDLFPLDTRRPEARLSWQRKPRTEEVVFLGPYPGAETEPEPTDSHQAAAPAGESPSG